MTEKKSSTRTPDTVVHIVPNLDPHDLLSFIDAAGREVLIPYATAMAALDLLGVANRAAGYFAGTDSPLGFHAATAIRKATAS